MIKMQIACFTMMVFMGTIFFLARRRKTKVQQCFAFLLIATAFNLIFDMITVYTVTYVTKVPEVINRVCHNFFLCSILVCVLLHFQYIFYLIQSERDHSERIKPVFYLPFLISMIGIVVGDLEYVQTPKGNYASGMAVFMCYASIFIYMCISCSYMIYSWKVLQSRKRLIIMFSMLIYFVVAGGQIMVPTALISGFGLTMIVFAIFLTLESPDMQLIELLRLEKKRADDANQAKSDFLAHMSHEIRTPITAVLGMDELILREYDEPQLNEYALRIQQAGETLLHLINDILDLSKIESGKIEIQEETYETAALFKEQLDMIRVRVRKKGIEVIPRIAEDLPVKLRGDEGKLKAIIANLLTNAGKYTQEGSIFLGAAVEKRNANRVRLKVWVEDTGIGIRQEDFSKVFQAFQRVDERRNRNIEGTGLGLNIVDRYLRMMESHLELQSEYGVGTVFSFSLWQDIVEEEELGDFGRYDYQLTGKKEKYQVSFVAPEARVMVVDDNEVNRQVFCGLLKETKVQIKALDSGKACLEELCQHGYDIIFMDHMMPDMDGIVTLGCVRKMEQSMGTMKTPIIMLTANVVIDAKKEYLEAGFDDFLSKPMQPEKLEKMLIKYLPKQLVTLTEKEGERTSEVGGEFWNHFIEIPELDARCALENCGNPELLEQTICQFYNMIDGKISKIETYLTDIEEEDARENYTIEVHGLKSSLRLIGNRRLGDLAEELELCGKQGNTAMLQEKTPLLLKECGILKKELQSICNLQKKDTPYMRVDSERLLGHLDCLSKAMKELDVDQADGIMKELHRYVLPEEMETLLLQLDAAVLDLDVDRTEKVVQKIRGGYRS